MTLAEALVQKLGEKQCSDNRQVLTAQDDHWSAILHVDHSDDLSCKVWELTLRRTGQASGGSLPAWADRVADRVTGLMEPLRVHEVDPARNEALLRSHTPVPKSEQVQYYEVHLKGTGQAQLRRFEADHQGSKRKQVDFVVTHEALTKFIGDVTAED